MRKRLGIPRIIKAAAGPHVLNGGGRGGDWSPLEAHYDSVQDSNSDSDTDSDTASSLFDDDSDDDGCSVISTDTESDIVMHNTTAVRHFLRRLLIIVHSDRPPPGRKGRFRYNRGLCFPRGLKMDVLKTSSAYNSLILEFRR